VTRKKFPSFHSYPSGLTSIMNAGPVLRLEIQIGFFLPLPGCMHNKEIKLPILIKRIRKSVSRFLRNFPRWERVKRYLVQSVIHIWCPVETSENWVYREKTFAPIKFMLCGDVKRN
jgi:hypothetical protein